MNDSIPSNELLPCPFCGATNAYVVPVFGGSGCRTCGAMGPTQGTMPGWNRRASNEPQPASSNSCVDVLRSWADSVVNGNLATDLRVAADEIELLEQRLKVAHDCLHQVRSTAHEPCAGHEPADPDTCCIFSNGSGSRCVTHQTTWGSGPCPETLPRASQPPSAGPTQFEQARDAVVDVVRSLSGEARAGATLALNAIAEAMIGTRESHSPPSAIPDATQKLGELAAAHVVMRLALQKIVSEGDFTAPEGMKRVARDALDATASAVALLAITKRDSRSAAERLADGDATIVLTPTKSGSPDA